jgi:hypothetical protein
MAGLLKLPDEIVSIICKQQPAIIPNLRLACHQLHDASFFTFLGSFFEVITVLAHHDSLKGLLEIANEPRFRLAVKTVEIEAYGAFLTAYETLHL